MKRNRRLENNSNFEVIANRLGTLSEKGSKCSKNGGFESSLLEKEIESRKSSVWKKESMIKLLKEKKLKLKENLERLKENIVEKRKILENAKKELSKEKSDEKNFQMVINNIKRNTFTLVLE